MLIDVSADTCDTHTGTMRPASYSHHSVATTEVKSGLLSSEPSVQPSEQPCSEPSSSDDYKRTTTADIVGCGECAAVCVGVRRVRVTEQQSSNKISGAGAGGSCTQILPFIQTYHTLPIAITHTLIATTTQTPSSTSSSTVPDDEGDGQVCLYFDIVGLVPGGIASPVSYQTYSLPLPIAPPGYHFTKNVCVEVCVEMTTDREVYVDIGALCIEDTCGQGFRQSDCLKPSMGPCSDSGESGECNSTTVWLVQRNKVRDHLRRSNTTKEPALLPSTTITIPEPSVMSTGRSAYSIISNWCCPMISTKYKSLGDKYMMIANSTNSNSSGNSTKSNKSGVDRIHSYHTAAYYYSLAVCWAGEFVLGVIGAANTSALTSTDFTEEVMLLIATTSTRSSSGTRSVYTKELLLKSNAAVLTSNLCAALTHLGIFVDISSG